MSAIDNASAIATPPRTSRFRRIADGSMRRLPIATAIASADSRVARIKSAIVGHSACQPPAARSCSCGIAASIVATRPGVRIAPATAVTARTGFCLCGIDDEPPLPCASKASPTSDCASMVRSRPILPSAPQAMPNADATSAMRSRWVCHGIAGTASPNCFAIASATAGPASPSEASVPDAPPSCSTCDRSTASRMRARQRPIMSSQPAAFRPNVVGLACWSHVRPGIGVDGVLARERRARAA